MRLCNLFFKQDCVAELLLQSYHKQFALLGDELFVRTSETVADVVSGTQFSVHASSD
jgi:hypothetical protein